MKFTFQYKIVRKFSICANTTRELFVNIMQMASYMHVLLYMGRIILFTSTPCIYVNTEWCIVGQNNKQALMFILQYT